MAKNIQINYNNGNGYEVLHPESNPNMVGTYGKSEIDNKINNIGKWVKFKEKTITMSDYASAVGNKTYIRNIFGAGNLYAKSEDIFVKASGTMTIEGSVNPSDNIKYPPTFTLCLGSGYVVTSPEPASGILMKYAFLSERSSSIKENLQFENTGVMWLATGHWGNHTDNFGMDYVGSWIFGNKSGITTWLASSPVYSIPTFNLQFVNSFNMNVKPTAMNINFVMYKRPGLLLNNNSIGIYP